MFVFFCQRASLKSIGLHWDAWIVMVCLHMLSWMLIQPDARFACWSLETARFCLDLSSYVGCIHMFWQGVFIHILISHLWVIIFIYIYTHTCVCVSLERTCKNIPYHSLVVLSPSVAALCHIFIASINTFRHTGWCTGKCSEMYCRISRCLSFLVVMPFTLNVPDSWQSGIKWFWTEKYHVFANMAEEDDRSCACQNCESWEWYRWTCQSVQGSQVAHGLFRQMSHLSGHDLLLHCNKLDVRLWCLFHSVSISYE